MKTLSTLHSGLPLVSQFTLCTSQKQTLFLLRESPPRTSLPERLALAGVLFSRFDNELDEIQLTSSSKVF